MKPITRILVVASIVFWCGSLGHAADVADVHSPLAPRESLQHLVVAPGLEVQLVAHEPQLIDPVAMRFDEAGRMWVVQMRDYPNGPADGEPPQSRISILKDQDGDGHFEEATVFADQLLFANGIQPWKGGVFVTMAGEVAYLKDTDGDDRADVLETWFTGFDQRNPQLRANHPRLGIDNHIYVSSGLSGGTIEDARSEDAEKVSIRGRDFRFDPRTRAFTAVSGQGQFGLTFDDFGNRFVCSNRNPLIHVVMAQQDIDKNPLARIASVTNDVARSGGDSRVFAITRAWTTSNLHAGQFTAACGVTFYGGAALPEEYQGNAFTCEPTGHLVHREIVQPHGVTFKSHPGREGVEFLASRDAWFSPVDLTVGPDGALYVVDMYRAVIEHPEWVPDELKDRADLHDGNDRGRIYRIIKADPRQADTEQADTVRADTDQKRAAPVLPEATSESLVDYLAHANSWWRETTARLLLERADPAARRPLEELAQHPSSALARVHALRVLEGLGWLTDDLLSRLLDDDSPEVIEQAIQVAESQLVGSTRLRDQVEQLCHHAAPRIRFRALLALAPFPVAPRTLADPWEMQALLIAAGDRAGSVLAEMAGDQLEDPVEPSRSAQARVEPKRWIGDLAAMAAATDDDEQHRLAMTVLLSENPAGDVGLARFLSAAAQHGISLANVRAALSSAQQVTLGHKLADAERSLSDLDRSDSERCAAIDLLALSSETFQAVVPFVDDDRSQSVRVHAIQALAARPEADPWRPLLAGFPHEPPSVRRAILSGVLARSERTVWLLDAIAAGTIKIPELGRSQIHRLLNHADNEIKSRSEALLQGAMPADRQRALRDYQVVLNMKADAPRGRGVFAKHCAICHRVDDLGVDVAPDISDSRVRSAEQYLTDIIDPNRAIDSNYVSYTLTTQDGRTFHGVLTTETSTSVTLQQTEGKTLTVGHDEIEQLTSTGMSFMPEGLEKGIPHQDMADLVTFLKNWRYLDGRTPIGGPP